MDQLFEMAMSKRKIGIAGRNHFTLLRETEPSIDTAWRLGANPAIGRAAPTGNRSAAAVKAGISGTTRAPSVAAIDVTPLPDANARVVGGRRPVSASARASSS